MGAGSRPVGCPRGAVAAFHVQNTAAAADRPRSTAGAPADEGGKQSGLRRRLPSAVPALRRLPSAAPARPGPHSRCPLQLPQETGGPLPPGRHRPGSGGLDRPGRAEPGRRQRLLPGAPTRSPTPSFSHKVDQTRGFCPVEIRIVPIRPKL